ncbi:hypothetical protein PG999_014194 [Apiospora kogelbergensis]|uniref:Uncharacterized protein n=1 Tax=Apiospora kogelbergensis TaxID=1337665 RepID=A0AAW0Q8Z4_9PEZI
MSRTGNAEYAKEKFTPKMSYVISHVVESAFALAKFAVKIPSRRQMRILHLDQIFTSPGYPKERLF